MHRYDADAKALGEAVLDYTQRRLRMNPVPLDGPRTPAELEEVAGATITAKGLGGDAALALFAEELAPACISTDHPRFLHPVRANRGSTLFDLVVGSAAFSAWTAPAPSSQEPP